MKANLAIAACLLLAIGYTAPAQEPKKVQEPEYLGTFFLLDPATGSLVPLERQAAALKVKIKGMGFGGHESTLEVPGETSPVRFSEGQKLEFVVLVTSQQIDPQSIVQLLSLESKKHRRRLVVGKGSMVTAVSSMGDSVVPFNAAKYGASSFKIIPAQALFAGEYALTGPATKDAFCFGIDVGGATDHSSAERLVPFRTGEQIPLGIVEHQVTITSVEVSSWPKAEELKKAEGKPDQTTSLTMIFRYANQNKKEWKCEYAVAILDDKGQEIGSGERRASLGGDESADTHRVSAKMRTLDFPRAAKLRIRAVVRPK